MLDDEGSCFQRALTDTISVVDVDIKERWGTKVEFIN